MTNQIILHLANTLRKASTKNDAQIWSKLAKFALKPSSARRVVNLTKVNKLTNENDVIVVPGKILGTGNISHKITLTSFSISNSAAQKVLKAGGQIMSFEDLIDKYPTGKGVNIIG